jgi:hypothetical protein
VNCLGRSGEQDLISGNVCRKWDADHYVLHGAI